MESDPGRGMDSRERLLAGGERHELLSQRREDEAVTNRARERRGRRPRRQTHLRRDIAALRWVPRPGCPRCDMRGASRRSYQCGPLWIHGFMPHIPTEHSPAGHSNTGAGNRQHQPATKPSWAGSAPSGAAITLARYRAFSRVLRDSPRPTRTCDCITGRRSGGRHAAISEGSHSHSVGVCLTPRLRPTS